MEIRADDACFVATFIKHDGASRVCRVGLPCADSECFSGYVNLFLSRFNRAFKGCPGLNLPRCPSTCLRCLFFLPHASSYQPALCVFISLPFSSRCIRSRTLCSMIAGSAAQLLLDPHRIPAHVPPRSQSHSTPSVHLTHINLFRKTKGQPREKKGSYSGLVTGMLQLA